jgi:polysaccharide biosynthesis protein PslG
MKRAAVLILALAALGPAAASAAANDFAGIVAPDLYAGSPSYREKAFTDQQALGIGVIRQTLDWASIEYAPGQYDLTLFDNFVLQAAQHNLTVFPILFDPPPFWSSKPKRHAKHGTYFPKNLPAMGAFATVVAQRYGRGGSFWNDHPGVPALPMTAYQIWNEPNLAAYSPPKPSAKKYVAMLKATGPAIKAVDPNAEIVTAGLPDSRLSKPNLYSFIKQMYRAGAKGTFDTIGINPYAPTAKGLISKLKRIRSIMASFGDAGASMRVTELGWSDVGPRSPFRVGKSGQAKRIAQAVAALKRNAARLKLLGFFYFAWRDTPAYGGFHDFWGLHTGLLRKNGTRKPAYAAFKKAVAAL